MVSATRLSSSNLTISSSWSSVSRSPAMRAVSIRSGEVPGGSIAGALPRCRPRVTGAGSASDIAHHGMVWFLLLAPANELRVAPFRERDLDHVEVAGNGGIGEDRPSLISKDACGISGGAWC